MTEEFQKLNRAEIDRAEKEGECLGRNPDGGKIIDYVATCGGFYGETNKKAIARLLYVEEPPISQANRPPRKTEKGDTYGSGRWERLRMGRASFHPIEAQFVHGGLRRTHGETWARAFPADELVKMTFVAFLERVAELGLQVPIERIPPTALLKLLAASPEQAPLDLRVVDPSAPRLGGAAGSRNRSLKPVSDVPKHSAGENYVLQVRGMEPDSEQIFVFETSEEALLDESSDIRHQAFPVRLLKNPSANVTIRDQEDPFVFYDIDGRFAFVAMAFPSDWDFAERFLLDPSSERWDVEEFASFAIRLGQRCREDSSKIRFGLYEYEMQ